MKTKSLLLTGLFIFMIVLSGCGARATPQQASSETDYSQNSSAQANSSEVSSSPSAAFQNSGSSQPSASRSTESKSSSSSKIEITRSVEYKNYDIGTEISTDGTWEAYDTNKDDYQLHIRKADGTEDKVICKDAVLCPGIAGEWVYFFSTLDEIDRIKLDGSEKTKVCSTNGFQSLNGSTAITNEYKDGYILYKLVQMKEVGDGNSTPNPAFYYKLDLTQNKVIPVSN